MNQNLRHFIDANKVECGVAVVAIALLLLNAPSLVERHGQRVAKRAIYDAERQMAGEIEVREKARQALIPIAESRYTEGCEAVFQINDMGSYIALSENAPVIKGNYAAYYAANPTLTQNIPHTHLLPPGITVCDAYGNTGVIATAEQGDLAGMPLVTDLANTPNQELVTHALTTRYGDRFRPDLVNF